MSAAQGGKFWAGFAAGTLSSIAASFWAGGTDTTAGLDGTRIATANTGFAGIGAGTGAIGTLAFSAIAGGAGSALGGGNFWQGAVTGLIVAGFNHLMKHSSKKTLTKDDVKKIYDAYASGDDYNPEKSVHMSESELYDSIGGPLDEFYDTSMANNPKSSNFGNTCATRLSKAMNDSGYTIPKGNGALLGANGKYYHIKAQSMFNYLNKTYTNFKLGSTSGMTYKINYGLIAQSDNGGINIQHVDVIYNKTPGNSNFQTWGTTYIFGGK